MVLQTFIQGKDFHTYPESEYIRSKERNSIIRSNKPYDYLIYADQSTWTYDTMKQKIILQKLLLYVSGVFISFGSNNYEIDFDKNTFYNLLNQRVSSNYLKIRIYSDKEKLTLSTITFKTDDNQIIELNPLDATFTLVQEKAGVKIDKINDNTITITKANNYNIFFDLTFKLNIEYYSLKLKNIISTDSSILMLLFNTNNSALVYINETNTIEPRTLNWVAKVAPTYYKEVMVPFRIYEDHFSENVTKNNNHITLYIKPIFYVGQGEKYTAIQRLELRAETTEEVFIEWSNNSPYYNMISLGTFHKLNDSHFRLFKNSVVMPAFTEHTIYVDSFRYNSMSNSVTEYYDYVHTEPEDPREIWIGKYNIFYIHKLVQYEYPYGLTLYRYDYTYADYGNLINYPYDPGLYCYYLLFDREAFVNNLQIEPVESGKVFVGTHIRTNVEYPLILWNFEAIDKKLINSNINIIRSNSIAYFPDALFDFIEFDHEITKVHYTYTYIYVEDLDFFHDYHMTKTVKLYDEFELFIVDITATYYVNENITIEFTHEIEVDE